MKQNFLPARHSFKSSTLTIASIFALLLSNFSCTTLPRRDFSESQTIAREQNVDQPLRINVNSASAKELEALPGIGGALAERIIEHRTKHGPFRRPEHLMMVRGISDRKFRDLRGLISTE